MWELPCHKVTDLLKEKGFVDLSSSNVKMSSRFDTRIDYIFFKGKAKKEIKKCGILEEKGLSDHKCVFVDF